MTDAPTPQRAASAEERERLDAVVGRLMDLANAACQKGETAYTCGLTARSIAEDVRDIRRDLDPLLDRITAAETDLLALARMYGEACGDLIQEAADSRQLACSYDDAYDLAAAMKADRDRFADEVARLSETYTDDKGNCWSPPTAWAYFAACRALHTEAARAEAAEARAEEAERSIEQKAREVVACGLPDDAKWLLASKDRWHAKAIAATADRDRLADEVARLRGALTEIAKGETMTFDEGLGFEVSFWLDEEEMSEIARRALTATGGPTDGQA